jgi:cysteinyl-tRNA synthetase
MSNTKLAISRNMMNIRNTLSSKKEELNASKKVKIYLCGVTVYDEAHIGHARTIIVFDVFRRYLEDKGVQVELVQNFTDVDDKIINRASMENTSAQQLSSKYIENYYKDFDALNVKRATIYPKATEHIQDMQDLIQNLIERDIAYITKNGVYFIVSKFPEYGKLSKKKIKDLRSGERITVDKEKKDPLDFALWKFSESEPKWSSPWGNGRPGWHIECSTMSIKYLGENFDIHGGGRDLIFPHHENEIAQAEAYTSKPFAKLWMHVGMVTINEQKMSKSIGNVKTVKYVFNNWGPNVIRLFCLSGHYSKPIDYSEELLKEYVVKWRQVEIAYYELIHVVSSQLPEDDTSSSIDIKKIINSIHKEFDNALEDDFDTHTALFAFFRLVREINDMAAKESISKQMAQELMSEINRMLEILGLYIPKISDEEITTINQLIAKRESLRREKKYEEADRIRKQMAQENIETIDHKSKTIWIKKEKIPRN